MTFVVDADVLGIPTWAGHEARRCAHAPAPVLTGIRERLAA